jgi:predicted amidophosphoribosyltransferase
MAPLESARSGALCELCKNPLDLEVNFCPCCGFPVQDKFEAGTPSPRAYASAGMCPKGHWYNARLQASCPLRYRRYLRPLFSTHTLHTAPEQKE